HRDTARVVEPRRIGRAVYQPGTGTARQSADCALRVDLADGVILRIGHHQTPRAAHGDALGSIEPGSGSWTIEQTETIRAVRSRDEHHRALRGDHLDAVVLINESGGELGKTSRAEVDIAHRVCRDA